MEKSVLASNVQSDPNLRGRVEALVRLARWQQPDADPMAPVPLDFIMWSVASNNAILDSVQAALDNAPESDQFNFSRAANAVGVITDAALTAAIATALGRLPSEPPVPDPAQ